MVAILGLAVEPLGIFSAAAAAAPTGYVPMSALINGDSVTTVDGITDSSSNPISLEQYAAHKAGYTVTVVTGAQWDAMTAADFAKYQVLIVGDPDCSTTPTSATSNASVWAPVVMGTSGQNPAVGNRALVGTDPEFHYLNGNGGAQPTNPADPSTAGAEHLVQDGITYAGGVSGATGVYFDTSCGDNGSDTSVLNSLSSAGTGFTEDMSPPCGGSVQLIASNPVFATLTDADIQGWECSDHVTFPAYPTDWQPLAVATDTSSHPTCGTDPGTGGTACGEAYVLVAGQGIVVTAPDLALTPATGTDPAGGTHTVTATVTQSGSPDSGQTVSFQVTGQNAGVSGTCVPASCQTSASGTVTFTYPDTGGAGTDTINASVTIGGTTEHATASETWTAGSSHAAPTVDDSCTALAASSVTTRPGLDTTKAGDLLVAYATADGPTRGGQSLTVSGLGLTWTRAAQENAQLGDAEVWTATAPGLLTNGQVTAKAAIKGYNVYLTVVAYKNATGIGAVGKSAAASGAPGGTVTTTQDHSWVWGVGFDWTAAIHRTVGAGQTLFQQTTDKANNTDWVQSATAATPAGGTAVTINDTAPTSDRYDLVVVEIL
jgi:hypothetical protein